MGILNRETFEKNLREYYVNHFGEKETDVWYEQPTANIWIFGRDENIIILHCRVSDGKVTQFIERKKQYEF